MSFIKCLALLSSMLFFTIANATPIGLKLDGLYPVSGMPTLNLNTFVDTDFADLNPLNNNIGEYSFNHLEVTLKKLWLGVQTPVTLNAQFY